MHFDYITFIVKKFNAFVLAVMVLLIPFTKNNHVEFTADHSADQSNYTFVMVHGFQGWGEDVKGYEGLPYWGLFNGDALTAYREAGYTCVAPTLDPVSSVWDHACELYAKLKGTRVDYGKAHSEACGHDRYGEDYTGKGMLDVWDSEHKINLIGHSLGGPTCIMLTSLLANGAPEEVAATTDGTLSELFTGGKGDWVHSVTGLAAVYNGTSLFVNKQAVSDTKEYLHNRLHSIQFFPILLRTQIDLLLDAVFYALEDITSGTVADPDTAVYDMQPDNALKLNETIDTVDSVYYFSVIQDATKPSEVDGHLIADPEVSDPLFIAFVPILARTNMITPNGLVLDAEWVPNDGCANTISQKAPLGAPMTEWDEDPSPALASKVSPGTYNVLPVYRGTHMAMIGDFLSPNLRGPEYLLHVMEMISALA